MRGLREKREENFAPNEEPPAGEVVAEWVVVPSIVARRERKTVGAFLVYSVEWEGSCVDLEDVRIAPSVTRNKSQFKTAKAVAARVESAIPLRQ